MSAVRHSHKDFNKDFNKDASEGCEGGGDRAAEGTEAREKAATARTRWRRALRRRAEAVRARKPWRELAVLGRS